MIQRKKYTDMQMRFEKFISYDKIVMHIEKQVAWGFYYKVLMQLLITILQAKLFFNLINEKMQEFTKGSQPV